MTRHNFKIVNMPSGFYLSEKEPKKIQKVLNLKYLNIPEFLLCNYLCLRHATKK